MSLECSECERDLRGPHDPGCSRWKSSFRRLVRLYTRASAAAAKSNELLNQCSRLEEELFETSRGEEDMDILIDDLEYATVPHRFTEKEVREIWKDKV